MKFVTFVTALAAVIPATFGFMVNTPSGVTECEPAQITWNGGTPPYFLTFVPAAQISAPAIKQFPTIQSGTSYTWNVDLQFGTSFTIALRDSTGQSVYSDIVTIQAGTSSSCVNTSVQESGSGNSAGGSTATSGSSGASATGSSASGSATTSASSSSSTQKSGASHLSVSSAVGVAGIMGLVGAALF